MEWLRLWHDMPNDPKWGTIARKSGEPISLVIALYVHILVDASRNVTRGHVTVTNEDLATALCVTDEQIAAVMSAMEGRVIENGYLLGWDKRQPKREDAGNPETGAKSAAQRKAEQRERERLAKIAASSGSGVTDCHGASRNVTTDKRREEEIREDSGGVRVTPAAPVDNHKAPPMSSEFQEVLNSRPDLNPDTVWQNFWDHYQPEKRTLSRWRKWVETEHPGPAPTAANDPDTKVNVEALAATKGIPPWDNTKEDWFAYRARVRAAPPITQPQNHKKWLRKMTARGSANAAK